MNGSWTQGDVLHPINTRKCKEDGLTGKCRCGLFVVNKVYSPWKINTILVYWRDFAPANLVMFWTQDSNEMKSVVAYINTEQKVQECIYSWWINILGHSTSFLDLYLFMANRSPSRTFCIYSRLFFVNIIGMIPMNSIRKNQFWKHMEFHILYVVFTANKSLRFLKCQSIIILWINTGRRCIRRE